MDNINLSKDTSDSSDSNTEQLLMENELLRMKIIAEFGGVPGELENVPPEIANQFLKNVIAFEQQYANARPEKVVSVLGNPTFKNESDLDDKTFSEEWKRLNQLLDEKSIAVGFIRPRDDRFRYRFITEELFQHEIDAVISIPGMVYNFTYEEFHPDHEQEIRDRTIEFLAAWFDRKTEPLEFGVLTDFIKPDRAIIKREDLIAEIQRVFDSCSSFEDCRYRILEVKFELRDNEDMQGIGHAEGVLKFKAVTKDDGVRQFDGPFKFYLIRKYDWWSIFYFVMPGFDGS